MFACFWTPVLVLLAAATASTEWITTLLSLQENINEAMDWSNVTGLSSDQRLIAAQNSEIMPFVVQGVKQALEECRRLYANETWNCTWTNEAALKEFTPETAYLHAIISGGISRSLAEACATSANVTVCGCAKLVNNASDSFVWDACSHNLKFAHKFSLNFVEAAWKHGVKTIETIVVSRNSAIGRKVLTSRMATVCRCNGFLGACKDDGSTTKVCKKLVPPLELFAAALRENYANAKKLNLTHDLRTMPISPERDLRSRLFAGIGPRDLVYLDESPNYCEASEERELYVLAVAEM
ncbi:MOM-2 protein [Aphelenchoides avenae]|nr:MOM-2 protein [Aphelenchus avenae]